MIEIHENLGIDASVTGPMQTLVKEGRIMKISVRSGLPQERYIYLVSEVWSCDAWQPIAYFVTSSLTNRMLCSSARACCYVNKSHWLPGN